MTAATATLSAHTDADAITREQLRGMTLPLEPTETFKPVSHIELVDTLDRRLAKRGFKIVDEKLALRRDGAYIFGVMKVQHPSFETEDGIAALGFRQATNREMSVQMVAGLAVFVCDNLCFRGDMIALTRKHTARLIISESIDLGLNEFTRHYQRLTGEIEGLKTRQLEDVQAKALMFDAFNKGLMPVRLLPKVAQAYFEPPHTEFEPRTAWSLHNAFTEVAKTMPITTRMEATKDVGEFFGMVGLGSNN